MDKINKIKIGRMILTKYYPKKIATIATRGLVRFGVTGRGGNGPYFALYSLYDIVRVPVVFKYCEYNIALLMVGSFSQSSVFA